MPFINGRFYINPIYGAAVERARLAESDPDLNDEVFRYGRPGSEPEFGDGIARPGVTYSPELLPAHSGQEEILDLEFQSAKAHQRHAADNKQGAHSAQHATQPEPPSQNANRIYNETSGLRPLAKGGPHGTETDLHSARVAISHVIRNRHARGIFEGVASNVLTHSASHAVQQYPPARNAYRDSGRAAQAAASGPDTTGGATHFYLDYGKKPPSWAAGKRPVATFGPFKNVAGGGDVPKDAIVRIVIIR